MKKLTDEIVRFFHKQNFVIVSTIGRDGSPHSSCKGIVEIEKSGKFYLLDLYRAKTYENLKQNHHIAITAVDEHGFKGYCLKGKAKITNVGRLKSRIARVWEKGIASRITQRIIKNIRGEKGHPRHPEALLPKPEYLIVVEVKEVVNLTPHPLK